MKSITIITLITLVMNIFAGAACLRLTLRLRAKGMATWIDYVVGCTLVALNAACISSGLYFILRT